MVIVDAITSNNGIDASLGRASPTNLLVQLLGKSGHRVTLPVQRQCFNLPGRRRVLRFRARPNFLRLSTFRAKSTGAAVIRDVLAQQFQHIVLIRGNVPAYAWLQGERYDACDASAQFQDGRVRAQCLGSE